MIDESKALAFKARTALSNANPTLAIKAALAALPTDTRRPDRPFVHEAETALAYAYSQYRSFYVIKPAAGALTAAQFIGRDRLLAGSSTGRVWISDVAPAKEVRTFSMSGSSISEVAVGRNGRAVAASSIDGTVRIWSVQNGQLLAEISTVDEKPEQMLFSGDGDALVIKYTQTNGVLGNIFRAFSGPSYTKRWESRVYVTGRIAMHPRKPLIAGFSENFELILLSLDNGQVVKRIAGAGTPTSETLSFSADGRYLALGTWQGKASVFDIETGLETTVVREMSFRTTMNAAISPDGEWAAYAASDGKFELRLNQGESGGWQNAGLMMRHQFNQASAPKLMFDSGSGTLVVGLNGGRLSFLSTKDNSERLSHIHFDDWSSGADGATLVEANLGRALMLSGPAALVADIMPYNGLLRVPGYDPDEPDSQYMALKANFVKIGDNFSESKNSEVDVGGYIVKLIEGNIAVITEKGSGRLVFSLGGGLEKIQVVGVVPNRPYLVIGTADRKLRIYDLRVGGLLREVETGTAPPIGLNFDKGSSKLVVTTFSGPNFGEAYWLDVEGPRCMDLVRAASAAVGNELSASDKFALDIAENQSSALDRLYKLWHSLVAMTSNKTSYCGSG